MQSVGANDAAGLGGRLVFMLTQAPWDPLPDAPHDNLYVDPHLPDWLPDLTVHDLRIGKHMLDITCGARGTNRILT